MMSILPPRHDVAVAFLKPGALITHRVTGAQHLIERADHIRTTIESGWFGPGSPHTEKRVREGTSIVIKIGDTVYREHGSGPNIADLVKDFEIPRPRVEPSPFAGYALSDMERQGDFRFYQGQRRLLTMVSVVDGALIAGETGAGKTLLGIALLFLRQPKCGLILVPQGVLAQWQEEFARFLPGKKLKRLTAEDIRDSRIANGLYISYHQEFLLNDGGLISKIKPDCFDMVVVDESHLIQNPETLMGETLWRLQPQVRYALTATPVPNRLRDIYPICRWLRPDVEYKYNTQHEWIEYPDGRRVQLDPIVPVSPILFAAELSQVVAAVRKIDLRPDLPPCHISLVRHALSPEQAVEYKEYENSWTLKSASAGMITRVRTNLLRGVLATGDTVKNRAIRNRALTLVAKGEQVIITYARVEQGDWLEEELKHLVRIARIDSEVLARHHGEEAAAFKAKKADVLLMGNRCAYGYSFVNCRWLLIGSFEWSWGAIAQVLGRPWRVNSPCAVYCEIHVCENTKDEEMVETVALKEQAATAVLYGTDSPLLLEPACQMTQRC